MRKTAAVHILEEALATTLAATWILRANFVLVNSPL
jgi:hypothetical protein